MTDGNNLISELSEILEKVAKALHLKNYEWLPDLSVLKGEGFLSEFFSARILDKDSGITISVALKKEPKLQYWQEYPTAHNNELHFYEKVFPILDEFQRSKNIANPFNNIAKYITGSGEDNKRFIALEHLKPLGFALHDKTQYFSPEMLEHVIKVYGKFHALSFSLQQQQPEKFQELAKYPVGLMKTIANQDDMSKVVFESYLSAVKFFDPVRENHVLDKMKKIENIKEAFIGALTYTGKYKCLIHGDCWSNNMMFKYDNGKLEDMRFLDFQLIDISSPIYDLCYYFYTAAEKSDLDKLDYYLDIYHESLSDFSKELGSDAQALPPRDVLKEEWKHCALFGVIFGLHLWTGKLCDAKSVMEIAERENMSKDDNLKLFKEEFIKVSKSPAYRERARNIILHAIEYGIL